MSRYFKLRDNMNIPGRWFLAGPLNEEGQEIDPWQFSKSQRVDLTCVPHFTLYHGREPVDFSQTGLGAPVVSGRVAAILQRLCPQDVQLIPARVEGQTEPWFILNILRTIRCIDDARSAEVEYWKPEDGRPEKVGQYRNIMRLKVDPTKIHDAHIFRTWGWSVAMIISEPLKQTLEQEGITGMKYIEA